MEKDTSKHKTQIRQLKLQPLYRKMTYGQIKVTSQLLLCGNWLEQAGFHAEDYVNVIVREGLLVIQIK
mgnify:CR=1 FL=1